MIYLASLSPRRCELLQQIQVKYQQVAVDVNETCYPNESPPNYVTRLAISKAQAGYQATQKQHPTLGADTAVVLGKRIFGKPSNVKEAKTMLQQLSARRHQVMTAVAIIANARIYSQLSVSQVQFKALTDAEIDAYIATNEPLDKAGAYGIQGKASVFIQHLEGSYSGVMGLPLHETAILLEQTGVDIW